MPRAKKPSGPATQGGYQGQGNPGGGAAVPPVATGLPYGEHQQLAQAQQVLPVPGVSGPPPGPAPAGPPVSGGNSPADPAAALSMAAQAMRPPNGGLLAPTNRPGEPVTHGLASGPGAGPEILGGPAGISLADQLQAMARSTNDPKMAALAELARVYGGSPGA